MLNLQALLDLAKNLCEQKCYKESISICKRALKESRQSAFLAIMGTCYSRIEDHEVAITSLSAAERLAINSSNEAKADIALNLGIAYYYNNQVAEAMSYFIKADNLSPNDVPIVQNIALVNYELGYIEQAIKGYERILKKFNIPEIRFALSIAQLELGNYADGWKNYEARLETPIYASLKTKYHNPWNGKDNLDGKTILVVAEQGFGDNIQFLRFIYTLKDRYSNATVIYICDKLMENLFYSYAGEIDCYINWEEAYDYYAPISSLPCLLNIGETDISGDKYLFQAGLVKNDKYKIGFSWSSSTSAASNYRKNCELKYFIDLLNTVDGIELISLQKEISPRERELLDYAGIENAGEKFRDFRDTANKIHQLDLVISIDGVVGHLAAAMGKPTWIILRAAGDWRYPRFPEDGDSTKTPWYSSMVLFRQDEPGDWKSVFAKIKSKLLLA